MIPAAHTWKGDMVCRFFSGFRLNRIFPQIHRMGSGGNPEGSILMVANHFSWWDGFIQYRLNREIYQRKFHVMMLEEQLKQNRLLNGTGAFSVRKHSRDMIESLQYASLLLQNPEHLVLLFPQGRIESNHQPFLHFQKGVEYVLKRVPEDSHIVFNVNLIDFHAGQKPSLYIYYSLLSPLDIGEKETLEMKYNQYYRQCKEEQQKIWI